MRPILETIRSIRRKAATRSKQKRTVHETVEKQNHFFDFFAAGFLATRGLAADFLAAFGLADLTAGFLAAFETGFLAAGFLATRGLAADFLAAGLRTAFGLAADFLTAGFLAADFLAAGLVAFFVAFGDMRGSPPLLSEDESPVRFEILTVSENEAFRDRLCCDRTKLVERSFMIART